LAFWAAHDNRHRNTKTLAFSRARESQPGGDTFYWRFLEFGTETAPAKPFMRKALSSKVQEVQREFIQQYSKAIDRYLAKAAKSK